ncbi:MAG: DUF2316 family protein [Corynebacterium sp.]|uniref:DUF2316 family protein n=1 Tax=unclassified Corynebacterium TaxID=2624378 RepID=UPI000A7830F2|nr:MULTISPECIES: DUF2316 family protein [unclassified Corynebacterium]MDU1463161.1 DUF2316 family protein [Corynebacterium sp.]MDU2586887.1 DUF2316 family protein [Corynebacterium sp.]MDU5018138.1 DUF2316 family protein [Corynebacterium sp.]MDU7102150.1 DUF2316 family protein [Corynebacterium sp.]
MVLSPAEVQATCRELQALRDALPLADAPIESALGYAPGGLQAALDIQAGPIEVRRTRDYLVSLARAHGTPIPRFSWFHSWDVPAV